MRPPHSVRSRYGAALISIFMFAVDQPRPAGRKPAAF